MNVHAKLHHSNLRSPEFATSSASNKTEKFRFNFSFISAILTSCPSSLSRLVTPLSCMPQAIMLLKIIKIRIHVKTPAVHSYPAAAGARPWRRSSALLFYHPHPATRPFHQHFCHFRSHIPLK